MTFHILNGDALTERFRATGLQGEIVVCREALISGDVSGESLAEFWQVRANYHAPHVPEDGEDYASYVVNEFNKVFYAPASSTVYLWFGYDLFCQVNLWFLIKTLDEMLENPTFYIVYPSFLKKTDVWKDFGGATVEDLKTSFDNKIAVEKQDIELAKNLWLAFKNHDLTQLKNLAKTKTACFPYLKQVCQAHIDRFDKNGQNKLDRLVKDIIKTEGTDFWTVFNEFFRRKGIYGFGDVQFKEIYDKALG